MGIRISILFLSLISLGTIALPAQTVDHYTRILERGKQAADSGEYQQALDIWAEVLSQADTTVTDPRIGIEFIRLATEHELKSQYERAVELYYWGLSNPNDPTFEEELDRELERIRPLLDDKMHRRWRRLASDQNYDTLAQKITRFWEWQDPTLNSQFNERLIEHWRRIAYARENFNKNMYTVYGTDERALIYIKYGSPDVSHDGTVSYKPGSVRNWLNQAYDLTRQATTTGMSSGGAPIDSASIGFADAQISTRGSGSALLHRYEREVRFQFKFPSYEVWVYKDVDNFNYNNLIFIFGDDGNTGEFGLRNSVEDMMPNQAFSVGGMDMEITPSYFLQLLFYEELITVDHYFADAFSSLQSRLYSLNGIQRWESREMRSQNRGRLQLAQNSVPEQRSTLSNTLPDIPVEVQQYRLLNEDNEPYYATYLFSNPYRAFFYDQISENSFSPSAYYLVGSAMGINDENNILFRRQNRRSQLREHQEFGGGDVDGIPPELIYLDIPYRSELTNQKFAVELHHTDKDSTRMGLGPFKEHVRALGNVSVPQEQEPLSTDRSQLEMGDLILGTRNGPEDELPPFGFHVKPEATISTGEDLIVHFEVYHLTNNSGSQPFQIEYVVTESGGFFKRLFTNNERVRLSLNYESIDSQFRGNLEIETSPFEPGDFELQLTATEPETGREVSRTIEFTVEP